MNKKLVELACISNEKIQKAREELAKIEANKEESATKIIKFC